MLLFPGGEAFIFWALEEQNVILYLILMYNMTINLKGHIWHWYITLGVRGPSFDFF